LKYIKIYYTLFKQIFKINPTQREVASQIENLNSKKITFCFLKTEKHL
jgi:hypothetical protein